MNQKNRIRNQLSQVRTEIDENRNEIEKRKTEIKKIKKEIEEISAERDLAYALITLLLSEGIDGNDESIKKKLNPFKNILKKCNV